MPAPTPPTAGQVCGYAMNQWTLGELHSMDPLESPFRRAMKLARGMLTVIDPRAHAFRRVWLCYEVVVMIQQEKAEEAERDAAPSMFLTAGGDEPLEEGAEAGGGGVGEGKKRLSAESYGSAAAATTKDTPAAAAAALGTRRLDVGSTFKYDLYTVDESSGRVHGLTDGLAAVDNASAANQAARQRKFPSHVLRAALRARLQDGESTIPADRRHILNSIVGLPADELESPPLEEHSEYHIANRRMCQRMVALTIDVACSQGPAERKKLLEALSVSDMEEFSHCFLHDNQPSRGFTEPGKPLLRISTSSSLLPWSSSPLLLPPRL